MGISGIGYRHYQNNTTANRYPKTGADSYPLGHDTQEQTRTGRTTQDTSPQDIYEAYQTRSSCQERIYKEEEKEEQSDLDEQETDTEILVKPDGSKIMMTTIRVGGVETVMSMEIAKPTNIPEGDIGRNTEDSNLMVSNTDAAIESAPEK